MHTGEYRARELKLLLFQPVSVDMIETNTLYWIAGILEGEGSFGMTFRGKRKRHGRREPSIGMNTTDLDIALRVSELLQAAVKKPRLTSPISKKPSYEVRVIGAKAAGWMMTLYLLLGVRRREQIRKVMTEWKLALNPNPRMNRPEFVWRYAHYAPANNSSRLLSQAAEVERAS